MAMIAYKCPDIQVVVVDINAARIAAWNSDVSPWHLQPLKAHLYGTGNTYQRCPAVAASHALITSECIACPVGCQESVKR